ncbi:hypothetical protein ACFQ8E_17395 [Isoptericola sp. NPDC056573]|uniref:hypothetical protein n=1 Tax=Isoptericola sp. NPDC056573 TaxID=3345868 RepID=UPI0036B35269
MSRRHARALAPAVVALLAVGLSVSGCADPAGDSGPSSSGVSDAPATGEQVAEAAELWGAAPQYVLTTTAVGFEAVPSAAGVFGADGFSVQFGGRAGHTFMFSAVEGAMIADDCATVAVMDVGGGEVGGPVTCVEEDGALRRTAGDAEEYAVVRDGVLVRVSGSSADHEALREAAGNVHVPTGGELAALVEGTPVDPGAVDPGTVERGDLPPGDGAPDNSVDAGG